MADFNPNVWAPWRMEYIRSLSEEARSEGCFFCRYWITPDADPDHHVVWRGRTCFVALNRFPYTAGHLLVATAAHAGDPLSLSEKEANELAAMTWQAVALLRHALAPQGFNVGTNLERCAGAGVPDHLHWHVVPRWDGDTNFMAVVGNVRVIPESLDALYARLVDAAAAMGLRNRSLATPDGS